MSKRRDASVRVPPGAKEEIEAFAAEEGYDDVDAALAALLDDVEPFEREQDWMYVTQPTRDRLSELAGKRTNLWEVAFYSVRAEAGHGGRPGTALVGGER